MVLIFVGFETAGVLSVSRAQLMPCPLACSIHDVIDMPEIIGTNQAKKHPIARRILLLLALVSSPLGCCGCAFLLDALPASRLPPAVNFAVNLFDAEARVENRSGETVYLTPFTTTTGRLVVIKQLSSIRQRNIPLQPKRINGLIHWKIQNF
jgi:hypothetical protein